MTTNDNLKQVMNECGVSLTNAARTIRELITQRNDALASTTPVAVVSATEARIADTETEQMKAHLEIVRQDLAAAMEEASAPAVPSPKPVVAPVAVAEPTV